MTSRMRRAFEPGHSPKFLVVIDETEECGRAVRFAARRVMRTGARLVMLSVIDSSDFQHWLGVGDLMKREASERAQTLIDAYEQACKALGDISCERVVRTGAKLEEILKLIEEDEDIAYLTLASGTGSEGPGPLVSMIGGRGSQIFPVPVVIVPGALTDAEIDALA